MVEKSSGEGRESYPEAPCTRYLNVYRVGSLLIHEMVAASCSMSVAFTDEMTGAVESLTYSKQILSRKMCGFNVLDALEK